MEKKVTKAFIKLSTWLLIIAMAGITTTGCSMSSKKTTAKQNSSTAETVNQEQGTSSKEQGTKPATEQGQTTNDSTKPGTSKKDTASDKTLNNVVEQYVDLLNKRDDKLIEKIIVAKSPAEAYTKNILQELKYIKPKYTYKNFKVTHKEAGRATATFSLNVHQQTLTVIATINKQDQNWKIYELLFPGSNDDY